MSLAEVATAQRIFAVAAALRNSALAIVPAVAPLLVSGTPARVATPLEDAPKAGFANVIEQTVTAPEV